MAKLEDVCLLITDGSHFSPKDIGEGFPMLSVKDMGDRDFSFSSCKHISKTDYDILVKNGCKPKKGDVLVAKDGSYFKYAFQIFEEREIVILSSIAILRPKTDMLDAGYLREFLMADSTYSTVSLNYISGTALKRVILQGIKKIQIPLPPLDEQRKIAAVLDKVNDLIAKRRQQLDKLDELVKAKFMEITDVAVTNSVRMGDVATYINGYAFKPIDWSTEGLPIIRIQNLNNKDAVYNYYKGELPKKYRVYHGDVLISWATHLEAYIWKGQDAWLNQHIFRAEFNKIPINHIYFVYSTEQALQQAFRNAHGFKPTMEHIKRSDFENAIIELPSLERQNQFAAFVEQTEKTKTTISESLEKLETLKKALMQEYFG